MRISHVVLHVEELDRSLDFYCSRLGMTRHSNDGCIAHVGYDAAATHLELRAVKPSGTAPYVLEPADLYWKIGITLRDIDAARATLGASGIDVTPPRQFRDIGYLCHLDDPDGMRIELLQHTFETTPKSAPPDGRPPLGGQPTLAHITLRCLNIDDSLAFYRDRLGMRLVSRQPVLEHGFTLYFLGYLDKTLPDADIEAVANREWLWQCSTTLIELQHLHGPGAPEALHLPDPHGVGFQGVRLQRDHGGPITFHDPHGCPVEVFR